MLHPSARIAQCGALLGVLDLRRQEFKGHTSHSVGALPLRRKSLGLPGRNPGHNPLIASATISATAAATGRQRNERGPPVSDWGPSVTAAAISELAAAAAEVGADEITTAEVLSRQILTAEIFWHGVRGRPASFRLV